MKIIAVIAAYNEEKMVGNVVTEVKQHCHEVIVVDDGSADGTYQQARSAGALTLRHPVNRGQGAALQTGIDKALSLDAEIIVTFDADGQLDASQIPEVISPILNKQCEVVLGTRFSRNGSDAPNIPSSRKTLIKAAAFITRFYTGLKISDVHNGFRAFSRKALMKIEITQDGMAHASEILEQIKKYELTYREVGVTVRYTEYSLQKGQKISNSFKIIWELFLARLSGK